MEAGLVGAAGLGVGGADGHVDGAADLLVEERVARVALDVVVRAEGELAQEARAGVHVEQRVEEVLALARRRPTTLPASNSKRMPSTSRPTWTAGKLKLMWPLAESSTGPVKTSPSGKFFVPSALIQVRPATLSVRSVPGRDDPQLALAAQQIDEALLALPDGAPGGDRVGFVQLAGGVDEVLVLGQRHLGVLGVRLGREERADPARWPGRSAPSGG